MKVWTSYDVDRIKNRIQNAVEPQPPVIKKKSGGDKGKNHIERILMDYADSLGFEFEKELRFCQSRQFRFDYAIPVMKIGIEYEGLMSGKSRHTTISGYTNDTEKYNLAVGMGWRVIRVTAINYKDFELSLLRLILKIIYK